MRYTHVDLTYLMLSIVLVDAARRKDCAVDATRVAAISYIERSNHVHPAMPPRVSGMKMNHTFSTLVCQLRLYLMVSS